MSEKTALELVGELIGMMGCPPPGQLIKLKSAIEREQAKTQEIISGYEATMEEMSARLKSAIVMRPIAELPDRAPDGCVIVAVNDQEYVEHISHGITGLHNYFRCWEPGILNRKPPTHFYILPLPKPSRRLHPCYMPGCGKEVVIAQAFSVGYFVSCSCGTSGPIKPTQQEAKDAWGYAE